MRPSEADAIKRLIFAAIVFLGTFGIGLFLATMFLLAMAR